VPPLIVSEKTLELNICAEILGFIRSLPQCKKAFWIGMKQDQEAKNGIDELISNVPNGMHLALQFKAPLSRPPNQIPYRYTINDKQNSNLLRLARNRPNAVYYIFPHYNTFSQMRSNSPNLLSDTYLLRIYDLQNLSPSVNSLGTHKVITAPPIATIRSEPIEVKLSNASTALRDVLDKEWSTFEENLISHEYLKEWLYHLIHEDSNANVAKENKRVIGQRLRGFSTFCIS